MFLKKIIFFFVLFFLSLARTGGNTSAHPTCGQQFQNKMQDLRETDRHKHPFTFKEKDVHLYSFSPHR